MTNTQLLFIAGVWAIVCALSFEAGTLYAKRDTKPIIPLECVEGSEWNDDKCGRDLPDDCIEDGEIVGSDYCLYLATGIEF